MTTEERKGKIWVEGEDSVDFGTETIPQGSTKDQMMWTKDGIARRREKVKELRLVRGYRVLKVADLLGCDSDTIYADLKEIKKDFRAYLKRDIDTNKKLMNYLVRTLMSIDFRINNLWDMFNAVTPPPVSHPDPNNPGVTVRPLHYDEGRFVHMNMKINLLTQIRAEEAHLMDVLKTYGILGKEEDSVGVSIEEVQQLTRKMVDIIAGEVRDVETRMNIRRRLKEAVEDFKKEGLVE